MVETIVSLATRDSINYNMFMAPFNTHFLIAEKIWPTVQTMTTWPVSCNTLLYGQFCFGCVATDVDKASETLTQRDTHFFDRTGDYEAMASHRTAAFIKHQAEFLGCPFAQLPAEAQAFALGYLCHLCVDEVSKHLWRRDTWRQFHHITPGSAFAALDEAAWKRIENYARIAGAVCSITVLDVIAGVSLADMERMHQGVCAFIGAKSAEGEYLALIDLFDRPTPEARREKLRRFRVEINQARGQVHLFKVDTLINAALRHSRRRLADLIEGRLPEPDYPVLDG